MAGASGVAGYEVEAEQRSRLARARGARAVRGKERVGGGRRGSGKGEDLVAVEIWRDGPSLLGSPAAQAEGPAEREK
jgi:hypothetical protein